jgi:hypothetical protein
MKIEEDGSFVLPNNIQKELEELEAKGFTEERMAEYLCAAADQRIREKRNEIKGTDRRS